MIALILWIDWYYGVLNSSCLQSHLQGGSEQNSSFEYSYSKDETKMQMLYKYCLLLMF